MDNQPTKNKQRPKCIGMGDSGMTNLSERVDELLYATDKLENYRLYIQNLLERHSHFKAQDDVQSELIFDTVRDRYQLMRIGGKGLKWVYFYYIGLHFDIKDGKI